MAEQPIIIKRIKKGGHGHHGGAWKVAYADFMTAMMAFFLLLWLLNSVTEEQLQGIADYFAPSALSDSNSGGGNILDGNNVVESLSLPPPTFSTFDDDAAEEEGVPKGEQNERTGHTAAESTPQTASDIQQQTDTALSQAALSREQQRQAAEQREQQRFQEAQTLLRDAISSIPELRKMADSLMVDNTPEGLRIQIVDQDGLSMFPSGSASMFGHTSALLSLVSEVVKRLPEKIAITGYTDAVPYAKSSRYGNWELSADRALATRRELMRFGVSADQIARVSGLADTDLLLPADPRNPRNRRISIVILKDGQQDPALETTPQ